MPARRNPRRTLLIAIGFLLPNILGVITFVVFPILFSIVLAFTNWDLRHHNMFKHQPLKFVGFDNFIQLINQGDFVRYLGNTLFLMMGIPFAVGGALLAAIFLSKDPRAGGGRQWAYLVASASLLISIVMLTIMGLATSAMLILLVGLACGILVLGVTGGNAVYRTLFYLPNFTAGVATFILWKKLYNPQTGPISQALRPVLNLISTIVRHVPNVLIYALAWLCVIAIAVLLGWSIDKMRRLWRDGDAGSASLVLPTIFLLVPTALAIVWSYTAHWVWPLAPVVVGILLFQAVLMAWKKRDFTSAVWEGAGSVLVLSLGVMVIQLVLLGIAPVLMNLPHMVAGTTPVQIAAGMARDAPGLVPPHWIYSYEWAKPSFMIIGLWAAIGSNNMLLYLAALSNIPEDLYEAANIDGAGRLQKFWNVTWPQLAPTTFFIAVMSTISGLQGGFQMARTMTQGGPDGATTTLSYYIYIEGFETGRLAFASAAAWALFLIILILTLINWRFGNRYVNE